MFLSSMFECLFVCGEQEISKLIQKIAVKSGLCLTNCNNSYMQHTISTKFKGVVDIHFKDLTAYQLPMAPDKMINKSESLVICII